MDEITTPAGADRPVNQAPGWDTRWPPTHAVSRAGLHNAVGPS